MLLIGSFGSGAIENIYLFNFQCLGWQVESFDIQTPFFQKLNSSVKNRIINRFSIKPLIQDINKEVLAFAKKVKPDFIFIFKGMELVPQTVEELKSNCKIIANFNPDHPFKVFSRGSGNSNVEKSLAFYDIHFSYAKNIVNQLKNRLGKEAFWIPFGYDDRLVKRTYVQSQYPYVIFVGAYDVERYKILKELEDQQIKIFGDVKWKKLGKGCSDGGLYQGKALYHEEYLYFTSASLGSINLLRKQNLVEQSHNMRTFEVPGFGGLLISQRTEEQQEFFEEWKEAIFFETTEELKQILKDISRDKININKIKEKAKEKSEKANYSYFYRAKSVQQVIESYI